MIEGGANITVAITLDDLRRFHREIIADTKRELEAEIAEDKSDFATEMCRLCCVVKKTGLLAIIYKAQTGSVPPVCGGSAADETA